MIFNVSHLKESLTCPQRAFNRYVHHRESAEKSIALDVGTLVHLYFAATLDPSPERTASLESALVEVSCDVLSDFDELVPALRAWERPKDWNLLAVEQELRIPIGGNTLAGRLDGLVLWNGKYWHLQHKTLRASRPVAIYEEQQRCDWHECAYERMAEAAGRTPFGGTILNLVRKLSRKTIAENPKSALVIRYVTRPPAVVADALRDMSELARKLAIEATPGATYDPLVHARPLRNRSACDGMFQNKLCEYHPVCAGDCGLDDPRYVTIEPRYQETP